MLIKNTECTVNSSRTWKSSHAFIENIYLYKILQVPRKKHAASSQSKNVSLINRLMHKISFFMLIFSNSQFALLLFRMIFFLVWCDIVYQRLVRMCHSILLFLLAWRLPRTRVFCIICRECVSQSWRGFEPHYNVVGHLKFNRFIGHSQLKKSFDLCLT